MIEISFVYKLKHIINNVNYGKIVIHQSINHTETLDLIIKPFIITAINLYRKTLKIHNINDVHVGILGVSTIESSINEKDIFNLYIIENKDNTYSYYIDGNLLC